MEYESERRHDVLINATQSRWSLYRVNTKIPKPMIYSKEPPTDPRWITGNTMPNPVPLQDNYGVDQLRELIRHSAENLWQYLARTFEAIASSRTTTIWQSLPQEPDRIQSITHRD